MAEGYKLTPEEFVARTGKSLCIEYKHAVVQPERRWSAYLLDHSSSRVGDGGNAAEAVSNLAAELINEKLSHAREKAATSRTFEAEAVALDKILRGG